MCIALTIIGVQQAKAYTTEDLTNAGWTLVDGTTITLTDLDTYYYLFVDGTETNKSLAYSGINTDARPVYQLLQDPTISVGQVWKLEASDDKFKLKSNVNDYYYCSNSWGWNSYMGTNESYTEHEFVLGGGKYKLHVKDESGNTKALGAWGNYDLSGGGVGYAGTAGNKDVDGSNDRGFYIYRIARTNFTPASKPSANYAAAGWTQVTAESGLGLSGYYYVFLDISETDFETGMVMSATENGLPQYKWSDMDDNKQLWTMESSNGGYALKNVEYGKYSNYTAPWSGNMSTNLPGNVFKPTYISYGKWEMKNTADNNNWLGRWGDSDNGKNGKNDPFAGEQLAANKGAGNGKRLFYIYSAPTIAAVATGLPANGDMAADTWYYIDIAAAADNYKATATKLEDIVYSGDAGTTIVPKLTTNTFTETGNSLAAQRYYVKSTSANNLVIAAASYAYEVGSATSDKSYIQKDNVVTISYENLGTNDPTAELTKNFSGVKFNGNTIDVTNTANGFTFTVPEVTTATAYTLYIPAGAIGYEAGSTYNAEQEITLNTPVIFDGEYYFQKKGTETYIGRGGDWGTRAVVTELGFSLDVSVLPNGKYYLKNHDWSLAANTDKYLGYTSDIFVDRDADTYSIEAASGGFVLKTHDGKYVKTSTNSSNDVPYDYLDVTDTEGDAIIWVPISKETYLANLAALRNAEASAIATSAGKSASTVAELVSLLATNFVATDVTSSISNADCKANLDNWTQVNYAVGNKNFDANGTCGEVWAGFGGIKQEISGLSEGIYKVSIRATWRPGDKTSGNRAGNEINTNAWVYANTATSSNLTQLKSWYAGGATIDSRADMVASGDTYLNDVYVYVSEGETLTIGLASPSTCNGAWLPFFGWSLTYYDTNVSAKIGDTGWTTFASPCALDLSKMTASEGDVTAFYASNADAEKVSLESTDQAVAAGTGLMLKGTAGATITIPVVASGTDISSMNLLVGCTAETVLPVNANFYVLVNNGGKAEFESLKTSGATIPAGKAYLNAGVSAARLVISIDGETAINTIDAADAEAEGLKDGKFLIGGKIVIVNNGLKYNANGQILK